MNCNIIEAKLVKFDEDSKWRATYLHIDGMLVILHASCMQKSSLVYVVVVCMIKK